MFIIFIICKIHWICSINMYVKKVCALLPLFMNKMNPWFILAFGYNTLHMEKRHSWWMQNITKRKRKSFSEVQVNVEKKEALISPLQASQFCCKYSAWQYQPNVVYYKIDSVCCLSLKLTLIFLLTFSLSLEAVSDEDCSATRLLSPDIWFSCSRSALSSCWKHKLSITIIPWLVQIMRFNLDCEWSSPKWWQSS